MAVGPLPGSRAQLPAPQTPGQAAHLSPWAPDGCHLSVPLTALSSLWPRKDVQGAWRQMEGVTALPSTEQGQQKGRRSCGPVGESSGEQLGL